MFPVDPPADNGTASTTVVPDLILPPPQPLHHEAPPVAEGPRMPRRIKWLDLPEEYGEANMKIRCWVNYPSRLGLEIDSGDNERVYPALNQVFLEHNGWLDEEGNPIPPANTKLFWDTISTELGVTLLRLISLEGSRLPSSLKRPSAS